VRAGALTYGNGAGSKSIKLGGPAWFDWLGGATRFAYDDAAGVFTARKEERAAGGAYWRAYRKVGGRLRRAYLGRSTDLTPERLAAAADSLARPPARAVKDRPPLALPATPGPLLGRERELATAREMLLGGATRLLTLTGPAGTGKTRLAVALAEELAASGAFPDGACFVDLSPLADAGLVLPSIAHALGLRADGDGASGAALGRALGERRLLLVLDNCEHVLPAAFEVAALLDACAGAVVLATSREPLAIRREQEFPVPPLPLPYLGYDDSAAVLGRNPAVALFVQRGQAVDPAFDLTAGNARTVAEICVRLDGLPLAIELAAARTKLLSPAAVLARLDQRLDLRARTQDAPARHRTLRAAIDWSYGLLPAEEQRFFARLGVFAGGCTPEAAESIGGCADALDKLGALVDKSLLLRELLRDDVEPRFRMLETVREYARERLAASGDLEAVQAAHAGYFVGLAEAAEPWLGGALQRLWLDRLERDLDNMRAALRWLVERGDGNSLDAAASLGWALWDFGWARGYLVEARGWMERLLARGQAEATLSPVARARALWLIAGAALDQGDYAAAPPRIEESLAIFRSLGDTRGIARGLLLRGYAGPIGNDLEAATADHLESARLFGETGDEQGVVVALAGLGATATLAGAYDDALRHNAEGLALARRTGDTHSQAQLLDALGLAALLRGDPDQALEQYHESVQMCAAAGSTELFCYCLVGLAGVALARGAAVRAARLLGAADAIREEMRLGVWPVRRGIQDRTVAAVRAALTEAAFAAAQAQGRALGRAGALDEALAELPDEPAAKPPAAAPSPAGNALSPRQREVAALIARGLTSRDIAETLVISERTADTHADNIRGKLGLRSRAEIASWATANGLLRGPSAER
jgi:predicted ATPase/DNA-binding CsgD family transcriptional regulator